MVRVAVVIPLLLACAACDKPSDKTDIADVNARNALARITALEQRVDDLESETKSATSDEADTRKRVDDSLAQSIDSLAEKHNQVVDHVYLQK